MTKFNSEMLKVYLIAGSQNANNPDDFLNRLTKACQSGITMFQFREKGPNAKVGHEKIELGQKVRDITTKYRVPLIVDDDFQLAQDIHADGIHVGQTDMSTVKIKKEAPEMILGLSIHDEAELNHSELSGVDYLGIGPIYSTATKSDAKSPIGIEGLDDLTNLTALPGVAIGGIHEDNVDQILKTSVKGVSVVSAITQSHDIPRTIQILKEGNS